MHHMTQAPSSPKLSNGRIAAYCLPAIPLSALSLPLAVFVPPLYAEHTTLGLNLIGTLFFVTRIVDVITDPTFGFFADRTSPRIGRRRFWMLASLPILMVSVWMLFNPAEEAGWLYLTFWLSMVYIGYTMSFISHLSWGAELSGLYDDRSRVLGARQLAVNGGMLTVLVLPTLLGLDGDSIARASVMGLYIVLALPVTIGTASVAVPDPISTNHTAQVSFLEMAREVFRNPHIARLLLAELCLGSALAITGSLFVWFSEDVMKTPEQTSLVLLIYFAAAVLSVPGWIHVAKRYEKHKAFFIAMVYGAITLICFLFLPIGGFAVSLFVTALYGIAFGAGIFLARAMMADIADYDTLENGTPRIAVFFSTLTLTAKVAGAAGPFIAYNILGWAGYDPNLPVTPQGEAWLKGTFVIVPSLLLLTGGWIIRGHKLTREAHDQIRIAITEQKKAATPEKA